MAKAAAKYKEKGFSSGILVNFVLSKILQVAFSKLLTFRPKKIIPLFLRPLFEETDAGGRFFILIFI